MDNRQSHNCLPCFLKVLTSIAIVVSALALPLGERNKVHALEGVCVMYCDDGGGNSGDYGYGGGGCANTAYYEDGYYDSGVTNVGDYHPQHPNVVWDGEYWVPAEGFHYVSDDPDDYRVERNYGAAHPIHPNVVWDGEYWIPEDGFHYVSDDPDDYRVARNYGSVHPIHPNVFWDGEYWVPEEGFYFASDDPDDFTVARVTGSSHPDHPNTIWDGEMWTPADGYIWASNDENDLSTTPRPVGYAHPKYPNTSWTGDAWEPAEGFVWASDDPKDLSVIPAPEPVQQATLTPAETLPSGPALSISEVPSPSGYRTEAERRAQLAKLSDEHIERELARIRDTLVRMKADFQNDVLDLEAWLKEAQTAEDDALKDSFGLLVGGSLDKYEELWEQYPRLKMIAKEGWDLAGKLEQAIKAGENPTDIEIYRGLLRDKMISTYKLLAEMGSDLASEAGGKVIDLGKFMIDYNYHAARWGLARNQIVAISKNLDAPNGKLEAQLAIKELQEDLIEEQERRLANAQ